jgi:hypothetical protein
MPRCTGAVVAAFIMASLAVAPSATGAVEVGNNCVANQQESNVTLLQYSKDPASTFPLTVPAAGVVTKWKVNVLPFPGATVQQLKVFRTAGGPVDFQVVGESSAQTVVGGQNTFDTRIPVQAGDRFGLYSASESPGVLFCKTFSAQDVLLAAKGNFAVGQPVEIVDSGMKYQVAVSAIVEPDVDGDGFGDETQDKCQRSAAIQAECPEIGLTSYGLVRKGSALVLVSATAPAAVTLSGAVSVPNKAGAKDKRAQASARVKLRAPKKNVAPGKFAAFTLKFPASLKTALDSMPPSQSLTLTATASTKDALGKVSKSTLKLKLKGRNRGT